MSQRTAWRGTQAAGRAFVLLTAGTVAGAVALLIRAHPSVWIFATGLAVGAVVAVSAAFLTLANESGEPRPERGSILHRVASTPASLVAIAGAVIPLVVLGIAATRLIAGAPEVGVDRCEFAQVNRGIVTCVSETQYLAALAGGQAAALSLLGAVSLVLVALVFASDGRRNGPHRAGSNP